MIDFYKYQGTGNDFILIDNRLKKIPDFAKVDFAKKWCDRKFGIGSDGIIFLENSKHTDFIADFLNPDGSRSFCGNGSRCAVAFAIKLTIVKSGTISFEGCDGEHNARVVNDEISISMRDVNEIELLGDAYFVQTGSPHYVLFDQDEKLDIVSFGRQIRYSERFAPEGTNVNLISELNRNKIKVKTYERGVEDETFSCGTGVTACALVYAFKNNIKQAEIEVSVKGGKLHVNFEQHENGFKNIRLQGPAQFVYQGIIHD